MSPLGLDSPGQCRRVSHSCLPRQCEPSEGLESLGPSDSVAPGTSCGQMPSFLPEVQTEW